MRIRPTVILRRRGGACPPAICADAPSSSVGADALGGPWICAHVQFTERSGDRSLRAPSSVLCRSAEHPDAREACDDPSSACSAFLRSADSFRFRRPMVGATGKDPSTRPVGSRSHDSAGEGLAPPAGAVPAFVLRRRGDLWSPAICADAPSSSVGADALGGPWICAHVQFTERSGDRSLRAPAFVLRRRGDLWSPAVPQPRPLPCGRGFLPLSVK